MPLDDRAKAEILLVEDNDDDVVITRRGFERCDLDVNLHCVEDGQKCMSFLRKEDPYRNSLTPNLILLDLNLPVMDGREVMAEISRDVSLRRIPVVILSTSNAEKDILDMYEMRCSSFITKPIEFQDFQEVIDQICAYWFSVVILPPAI